MVHLSLDRVSMAVLLAAGTLLATTPARAHCGDTCTAPLPYAVGPLAEVVAADGVLGFYFDFGRAESALEFFSVTVRDGEGAVVAGALELHADFSAIAWRPSAPWLPGASYVVVTRIDTAAWAQKLHGAPPNACVTYDLERTITIDAAPLPAPAAPALAVETNHEVTQRRDLESLVCCDGALPYMTPGPGQCSEYYMLQSDGPCVSRRERGTLSLSHDVDRDLLPPASAGNFVVRLLDPEGAQILDPTPLLHAATCLRFESLDLARGDVFVEERCLGEGLPLGDLELDPSAQLAEACTGVPYVCEVNGKQWDPERCKTWPDGADHEYEAPLTPTTSDTADTGATDEATDSAGEDTSDGGCGCTTGDAPVTAPLALVALALLRRRRS